MGRPEIDRCVTALGGLLDAFRSGRIVDLRLEREGMGRHVRELSAAWDRRFPGFPSQYFPFTSFWGEHYRGKRDAHLRDIIVRLLTERANGSATVLNTSCVFGRHARRLSKRLPSFRVVASDIDPNWNRIYQFLFPRRTPDNFEFIRDNVFDSALELRPAAVVFFGACGAVSDGAMDLAIAREAPFLMCRTCCHDNIGGNTVVDRRPGSINRFFRFKNWAFNRMRQRAKYDGFYFSDRYMPSSYPRSEAARSVTDSAELMAVARSTPDSDICRAIIDLDRYLYLTENGYNVCYQGELFVAERG